jgi:hypothetical protein
MLQRSTERNASQCTGTDLGRNRARRPSRSGHCADDGLGSNQRGALGHRRLPHGGGLGDYEDLFEGFKLVVNVVATLAPLNQVLNEDL